MTRVIGVTISNDVRIEEKGPLVYLGIMDTKSQDGYGLDMRPSDALTMAVILTRVAVKVKNDTAMRNG